MISSTMTHLTYVPYVICLLTGISPATTLDIRWCQRPMGLQSGEILDSALTATSAFDGPSVGPQHARLHVDRNGGAWCPKQQIAENVLEYLQIDLGNQSVISGIATQGRYGNGRGQEYAEAFRLEYWRPELALWRPYRRWDATQILEGNFDTTTAVRHDLNPPMIASQVRVIPYGIYPRTVCMRIELFGCSCQESISWYSLPMGHSWSAVYTMDDLTYDGFLEGSVWTRGLGMLTDGQYGLDNFKMDLGAKKGHGWVGWNNNSMNGQPVEIQFQFNGIRNFSAVHIHCNNYFSKNVQVFSKAKLRFSLNGGEFLGKSVTYIYMADLALEKARNVSIQIPYLCASRVQIRFWFAAHWIMISEITFQSEPADNNSIEETALTQSEQDDADETVLLSGEKSHNNLEIFNTESAENRGYFEVVVGALSALMLLLTIVIIIIVIMNHRKKTMQGSLVTFSTPFQATVNIKSSLNDITTATLPDKQPTEPVTTNTVKCLVSNSDHTGYATTRIVSYVGDHLPGTKFSSLRLTNETHREDHVVNLSHYFPRVATDPPSRRCHVKPTTVEPSVILHGNIRPLRDTYRMDPIQLNIPEIMRHHLKLIQWLGSSSLGEVYICHIVEETDYENTERKNPVFVRGGPVQEKKNFYAETQLISSLQHRNLCSLLAYSTTADTGWMIFECPLYGDLQTYLKQQTNDINHATVIHLASQIANAMQYLEERGLVHKDLAARNCLLGPELQVKVSDLAVMCNAFQQDYGEVRGRKPLPLRWLPWENLVLGKFSHSSAVWMLAVTVWEICTMAKEKPYHDMTDTQVILNADHFYYSDGKQVILSQPRGRPLQLYQWMTTCWSRDESDRPTCRESLSFLRQMSEFYP